jgi:tripartite-type tricarboxylate transporter receptor subunit TctC
LGQQLLIDNRGGAQGTSGTAIGAKANPDGYHADHRGNRRHHGRTVDVRPGALRRKPRFRAYHHADRATVHRVGASIGASQNTGGFLKLAASKPNGYNYGSGNVTAHLAQEVFYQTAKLKITHIPYRGSGPAMTARIAGEVQTLFSGPGAAIPQIRAGKIRALAVTTIKRTRDCRRWPRSTSKATKDSPSAAGTA